MAHRKAERNEKIVKMRDDPNAKNSWRAIGRVFDLAEPTVREIYAREKARARLQENQE